MKKTLLAILALVLLGACNFISDNGTESAKTSEPRIDSTEFANHINSFAIQDISYIEVFQVFDEKGYCLVSTHRFNPKYKYKYEMYEQVNRSALYYTPDPSVMLYNDLKIEADDFIMVDTYSYDTKGGQFLGIKIDSEKLTVPVYVRKSEVLKYWNTAGKALNNLR